jgi:hypothetical protein
MYPGGSTLAKYLMVSNKMSIYVDDSEVVVGEFISKIKRIEGPTLLREEREYNLAVTSFNDSIKNLSEKIGDGNVKPESEEEDSIIAILREISTKLKNIDTKYKALSEDRKINTELWINNENMEKLRLLIGCLEKQIQGDIEGSEEGETMEEPLKVGLWQGIKNSFTLNGNSNLRHVGEGTVLVEKSVARVLGALDWFTKLPRSIANLYYQKTGRWVTEDVDHARKKLKEGSEFVVGEIIGAITNILAIIIALVTQYWWLAVVFAIWFFGCALFSCCLRP